MSDRYNQDSIHNVIDLFFKIARDKMESEHDKKVLGGLRQMVGQAEIDLYAPQPRFQDAFFFPNM